MVAWMITHYNYENSYEWFIFISSFLEMKVQTLLRLSAYLYTHDLFTILSIYLYGSQAVIICNNRAIDVSHEVMQNSSTCIVMGLKSNNRIIISYVSEAHTKSWLTQLYSIRTHTRL